MAAELRLELALPVLELFLVDLTPRVPLLEDVEGALPIALVLPAQVRDDPNHGENNERPEEQAEQHAPWCPEEVTRPPPPAMRSHAQACAPNMPQASLRLVRRVFPAECIALARANLAAALNAARAPPVLSYSDVGATHP
jgi:hypothetical protein